MSNRVLQNLKGELRHDALTKRIYSVDASIYEIEPLAVFFPKSEEEVQEALYEASKEQIPVIGRGAGTGIAGGCIGKGLVIDCSKYLTSILEFNEKEAYVRCQAGVVQNTLNAYLNERGYCLGPDTSTGNRATLGGMANNNSSGAHSIRYGKMVDHVLGATLLLSDGDRIELAALDEAAWLKKEQLTNREGEIYRELRKLTEKYRIPIENDFPKLHRRVSGYNLDTLLNPFPKNLCNILVGSEGSFGITTELTIKLSKKPKYTALCILFFDDLLQSLERMKEYLSFKPFALEVIDETIVALAKMSPAMKGKLSWLPDKNQTLIIAEFDGESRSEVQDKVQAFAKLQKSVCIESPQEAQQVWDMRKAGLGLLLSRRTYSRAIAFIEDLAVDPLDLADCMRELKVILNKYGKNAGIYGHAGAGCVHIRPFIDTRDHEDLKVMENIMRETAQLVTKFKGSLTGEHGDGLVRSWLNKEMFGETLYQAFCDIKSLFDPKGLANPGKVVATQTFLENLRLSPKSQLIEPTTFLNFEKEGGYALSVDLCNGNGQCRKKDGLMCPSYQGTHDERHSTRARAQSLRSIIHGHLPPETMTSDALYEILDLCLECKGCKTQCPSQIDMAKLKAEFLYQYQEKNGYSLRNLLFAHIGTANQLGTLFPQLSNFLGNTTLSKKLLDKIGITAQLPLPTFTHQRFSKRKQEKQSGQKEVVLFIDTYTEFNVPHVGIAAEKVLQALGYHVITPPWTCCGRPFLSKGILKTAEKKAHAAVKRLAPYANRGLAIIGLEPSCLFMLKDDYASLINSEESRTVSKQCVTLEDFLLQHIESGLPFPFHQDQDIHLHVHCHQKALQGSDSFIRILSQLNKNIHEIPTGCCGMAGSFAHEKEHYQLSQTIAGQTLYPAVNRLNKDALLIANGFSCRSQIAHGTSHQAQHLAEILLQSSTLTPHIKGTPDRT